MIELLGPIAGFVLEHAHLAGAAGAIASAVSTFLGGWQKWAAIAAGIAVLGLVIFVQHERHQVDVANLRAAAAELAAAVARLEEGGKEIRRAASDLHSCQAVNAGNQVALAGILERTNAQVLAIAADAERRIAEARTEATLKETVHVAAQDCPAGNPLAYRDVQRFVREHPDPAAGAAAAPRGHAD